MLECLINRECFKCRNFNKYNHKIIFIKITAKLILYVNKIIV